MKKDFEVHLRLPKSLEKVIKTDADIQGRKIAQLIRYILMGHYGKSSNK